MKVKRPIVAFVLLLFLQITDVLFSYHGIRKIGIYVYEGNPVMVYLSEYFGLISALIGTKIAVILGLYVLYRMRSNSSLWFALGVYSLNFYNQLMFFIRHNGWL